MRRSARIRSQRDQIAQIISHDSDDSVDSEESTDDSVDSEESTDDSDDNAIDDGAEADLQPEGEYDAAPVQNCSYDGDRLMRIEKDEAMNDATGDATARRSASPESDMMQDERDDGMLSDAAEEATETECSSGMEESFEDCDTDGDQGDFSTSRRDISEDTLWSSLSVKDLCRIQYLVSTNISKSAAKQYMMIENIDVEGPVGKVLFAEDKTTSCHVCFTCSDTMEKCVCGSSQGDCYLSFADVGTVLSSFLGVFAAHIESVHDRVCSGEPTSAPVGSGIFREYVRGERTEGRRVIRFVCGFDGVRFNNFGSRSIWPFTLVSMDIDDLPRSTPRSVLLMGVYCGNRDPDSKIHDRFVEHIVRSFSEPLIVGAEMYECVLQTGCHDDQAKRKIYCMGSHDSPGTCYFCSNQKTWYKVNDNGVILRKDLPVFPGHLSEGLSEGSEHSFFNTVCPMFESAVDSFHTFNEGVFVKIVREVFEEPKLKMTSGKFPNGTHLFELRELKTETIRLPSFCRRLSGKITGTTGTEKCLLYSTAVVAQALNASQNPIACALVLLFHTLYRLNVEVKSFENKNLYEEVESVCECLQFFVAEYVPKFTRGCKVHISIYHLPSAIERYGSIFPLSTQIHESFYHRLKRSVPTELSVNLGAALIRSQSILTNVLGEFESRSSRNSQFTHSDPDAANLAILLRKSTVNRRSLAYDVPNEWSSYSSPGDLFRKTFFVDGRRFSSEISTKTDDGIVMYSKIVETREIVCFGRVLGCLDHRNGNSSAIVRSLAASCSHLVTLIEGLEKLGIDKDRVQKVVDCLNNTKFGTHIEGYAGVELVKISDILGHGCLLEHNQNFYAVPITTRIMAS